MVRLGLLFRTKYDPGSDDEAERTQARLWATEYLRALEPFDETVLSLAVDRVNKTYRSREFPQPGHLVQACEGIRAERGEQTQRTLLTAPVDPDMAEAYRIAARAMYSDQGQMALREGWGWDWWDAIANRGKVEQETLTSRQVADYRASHHAFLTMAQKLMVMAETGDPFDWTHSRGPYGGQTLIYKPSLLTGPGPSVGMAEGMIDRARRWREKFLSAYEPSEEPYDDPAGQIAEAVAREVAAIKRERADEVPEPTGRQPAMAEELAP